MKLEIEVPDTEHKRWRHGGEEAPGDLVNLRAVMIAFCKQHDLGVLVFTRGEQLIMDADCLEARLTMIMDQVMLSIAQQGTPPSSTHEH